MKSEYIEYLRTQKRYSPRTCEIYSAVLDEYMKFSGCPSEEQLPDYMLFQLVRSYEVYLMDGEKKAEKEEEKEKEEKEGKEKGEREGEEPKKKKNKMKLGPRTVSLHLSVLSGYCRFLMKQGVLKSNPVRLVRRPRQQKRLPSFLKEADLQGYFAATLWRVEDGRYEDRMPRVIISILAGTAIRRSELISLDRKSFDPARGVLHVRGKGDKMREIPLLPSLCKEISLYLQSQDSLKSARTDPDSPLIQTPRGGRLYPMFVERVVKGALGGVGDIKGRKSPHVLRHTLATELLDGGADLNSIKEFLGHSSLAATQVYTHNSIERLQKVYNNAHPRAKNGGKNGD